jgi:predicted nucleic acid-binding protein
MVEEGTRIMGGVNRLFEDLSRYEKVAIATMVLIYVLERHPVYFPLAKRVLQSIESGRPEGIISAITLTELLTAPAQANDLSAMRDYELYLLNFPHLSILPLDVEIAREAAHLRASTGLPTPDAVILATARKSGADAVITNDKRWHHKFSQPDILLFEEYISD